MAMASTEGRRTAILIAGPRATGQPLPLLTSTFRFEACSAGGLLLLNVVTLIALGGTVLAGAVAARSLRRTLGEQGDDRETGRRRFMAIAGL